MMVIFRVLDLIYSDYCMFWAACNLVYFGFFRLVEFTVFNLVSYVFVIYLGVVDVAVDFYLFFSCLRFRIKVLKIDFFRKGCFLYIGKGEFSFCVIFFLLLYLILRGDVLGLLFLFRDGRFLFRVLLILWLRGILFVAGI